MRQPRPSRRRKTQRAVHDGRARGEAAGKIGILVERRGRTTGRAPTCTSGSRSARARQDAIALDDGDVDAVRAAGVAAEGAAEAVPEIAPGEDRVVHLVDDGSAVASGEGAGEREERQAALGSAEPSAGSAGGAESAPPSRREPRRRPRPRRLLPAGSRRRDARLDGRRAARDRLPARLEHGFERFDAVVGRLEEEIVHDRLRPLELLHERERHGSARHRAAELRVDAVARRPAIDRDRALLPRLEEVRRLGGGGALLRRSALLLVHAASVVMCTV